MIGITVLGHVCNDKGANDSAWFDRRQLAA